MFTYHCVTFTQEYMALWHFNCFPGSRNLDSVQLDGITDTSSYIHIPVQGTRAQDETSQYIAHTYFPFLFLNPVSP
jgi:hypothetical protein